MHDSSASGNDFFKCDFCRLPWADDRPMIEGHRGSLICAPCLTRACQTLRTAQPGDAAEPAAAGSIAPRMPEYASCALCLLHKDEDVWISPAFPEAVACRWCVEKAATLLERDPEAGWKRP